MLKIKLCWVACVLLFVVCGFWGHSSSEAEQDEQYAVVIDAGSTGTRAFVFMVDTDKNGERVVNSFSCGKQRVGLSSFAGRPSEASEMFTPLLSKAAAIIPAHLHSHTSLFVKGTAGMRLLSEPDQEVLWATLVNDLHQREDVPFVVDRKNFGTISGHQEAFYAVLASNYIVGSIDGKLSVVKGSMIIGALDMGGSSNQLIIYNGTSSSDARVEGSHFWSHSWLRFGAEMVRERVLKYIYDTQTSTDVPVPVVGEVQVEGVVAANTNQTTTLLYLQNPCALQDHTEPYLHNYVFVGTGQPDACVKLLEHIMWIEGAETGATEAQILQEDADIIETLTSAAFQQCVKGPCSIDAVSHPTVEGHHFYAMSVYYYALDCVRQLGPAPLPHWPTPTVAELRAAADQFCTLPWATLEELYHVERGHSYTYPSQLPHRCLEALYIVTLLEKGFGFAPDSRSITFALEVGGKEVEWTLGFALSEVEQQSATEEETVANIDSNLIGELPRHDATPEGARFNADYATNQNHGESQPAQRPPAISPEDALRYIELANSIIATVEDTVEQWVEQVKNVKAQYQSVLQRFVRL